MKCMSGKLFTTMVVLVAVLMGTLACVLPSSRMPDLILINKFFDGMLIVLAVGALLKYLCKCSDS